ncbi:type II secretion system major pseudopilin GspG [soil metagenome]
MKRFNKRHSRGFTFLEIMFVVVIIGILLALVGPRLVGKTQSARITATAAQINGVEAGIKNYEMDMGTLPKKLDDLVQEESEDKQYKGPYLGSDEVPKDAWGEEFIYKAPGDHHKRGYDIWSKGPDKQENTEDDIVNWTVKKN